MKLLAVAVAIVLALAGTASADPEADADRAFHDALAGADINALEQLGALRPISRWTDDAWAEAARLAVRAHDFDRARRDLEQVIAIGSDEQLVRRARAELARITAFAGASGEWNAVATEHERIVPALHRGGDPRPALDALEKLVRAHPKYPRAPMLMVALANGWEREGDADRAIRWLREAKQIAQQRGDRQRASAELVRTLVRKGELDAARNEIDELARDASAVIIMNLRDELATAELRRRIRWLMWAVLGGFAVVAMISLRRAAGSWRAAARRLARPPSEAIFLVPIAAVLVVISYTGNPLIARTVLAIVSAGVITSWLSGAILEGLPGRIGFRRAAAHAAFAVVAIVAATYLAVERGHVIDFVIETWHSGHETG